MKKLLDNIILIVSLISLSGNVVLGQKYSDHSWAKSQPHTNIHDSLMGEDAIMIYQNQFIYNDIVDETNGTVSSTRTVMRKIKILTEKGLNDYSKVFVNLFSGERILVVDARTIKMNGKVIDLKTKDIKKIDYKSPFYDDKNYEQLRFSIPGVEIGDEVEIIYKVKSSSLNTGDDIFLHSYLPCLVSSFTFSSSPPFINEIKVYNGMPQYVDHKSEKNTVISWTLTNLPSIEDQHRAIYSNQIPYIRFVVRQYQGFYNKVDITKNNWNDVYKLYSTSYDNNEGIGAVKKGYLKEFIDEFKNKFPDKSNDELFKEMHKFIYDSIVVKRLEENDSKRALGYYLFNKYIDHYHLHLLYKELFTELDLKYYICFGRDKYAGILDGNFVAPFIINHIFYSFYNGNQMNFVYPYYPNQKYQINELPVSIQGTGVIMLSKGLQNSIFCEIKEALIPMNSSDVNYKLKKINITVDNLKDSSFVSTSNTTLSGVYSSFYRHSHKEDVEKEDYNFYNELICEKDISIKSLTIDKVNNDFPFNYSLNAEHSIPVKFNQLDGHVYNLKLSELLNVSNLYSSTKPRYLDYYTKYMYNDISSITLSFKNKVTIENLINLNDLSLHNDMGSVTLGVSQKDSNTITLYVSYKINKAKLTTSEYQQLINLNDALENVLTQSISLTTE